MESSKDYSPLKKNVMKQAILNLKKKLLLIELPGAKDIEISTLGDIIFKTSGTKEVVWLEDDRVVRKCIGKLTDIRESQFAKWVEEFEGRFENYESLYYTSPGSEFNLLTAKESFFSKLQADEIYFENPLGEKPVLDKESLWGSPEQDTQAFAALNYQIDKWEEAESKVWNINNCYLFLII